MLLTMFSDYKSELDSEVADAKIVGTRWGGAILGELYLREFVGTEVAWAHLDIAGPSRADSDLEEISKGGTGVATRTLISWLESRGS